METFISDLSKHKFLVKDKISGKSIRKSILELIIEDHPTFTQDMFLSEKELDRYRQKYVETYLKKQIGDLTTLEKTVLDSMNSETTLSDKLDDDTQKFTFGQRVADQVAAFGGSWKFIIIFGLFLAIWIMVNVFWFLNKGFDPYPFILLNLILSTLAAIQAPVIMMSQNRQEEKDRNRAVKDYMINLKSELEIRILHEKLDHLIISQEQQLIEINKVQFDMINDILHRIQKSTGK